jgi:hypothetical protein
MELSRAASIVPGWELPPAKPAAQNGNVEGVRPTATVSTTAIEKPRKSGAFP